MVSVWGLRQPPVRGPHCARQLGAVGAVGGLLQDLWRGSGDQPTTVRRPGVSHAQQAVALVQQTSVLLCISSLVVDSVLHRSFMLWLSSSSSSSPSSSFLLLHFATFPLSCRPKDGGRYCVGLRKRYRSCNVTVSVAQSGMHGKCSHRLSTGVR